MVDQEAQEDELLALASIFEDTETFSSSEEEGIQSGYFKAHLDLPQPFHVKFLIQGEEKLNELQHLPPIELYFNLPLDYPSTSPPHFTLQCKWLTLVQLSRLCKKLDDLWKENAGEVILFTWTSFIKDEVLEFLSIETPLDLTDVVEAKVVHKRRAARLTTTSDSNDSGTCEASSFAGVGDAMGTTGERCYRDPRAFQDIDDQKKLWPVLEQYDSARQEKVFNATLFTCNVCFQEKLGEFCIQFFDCKHVYCKECMAMHFTIQINDGSVNNMTCPDSKCESKPLQSQVAELVGSELFNRYDHLLLQLTLDTMSDVMYCPRKDCNCPAIVDGDYSMASCSQCSYVFCTFCKMVYHGVSPCKLKPEKLKSLCSEYEKSSEAGKKAMEQQYGKKFISQAIEESYTMEWVSENSKQCPNCKINIQKMDGCNKMTCRKCHTHFCWLCNSALSMGNPYSHFNNTTSQCFNKLFQGVVVNEDDNFFDEEF